MEGGWFTGQDRWHLVVTETNKNNIASADPDTLTHFPANMTQPLGAVEALGL